AWTERARRDQTAISSVVSSVRCWTVGASATVLSLLRYGRAAATAEIPMSPYWLSRLCPLARAVSFGWGALFLVIVFSVDLSLLRRPIGSGRPWRYGGMAGECGRNAQQIVFYRDIHFLKLNFNEFSALLANPS